MTTSATKVDKDKLLRAIEAQRNLMVAVATGGPAINSVNYEYSERCFAIRQGLVALGLKDPNPYADLWDWYGKWSSGDLPSYQSRRQYIRQLYAPLVEHLVQNTDANVAGSLREPTGWERVDRVIDKIRQGLANGVNEEDFQSVGLLCREALISLSQAVFDPAVHPSLDGVKPSDTDAKRMLEAYIEKELSGSSNEAARKYAKAALDLANGLQHSRTASFRDAAVCVEATTSVVNLIAIISGRRDPTNVV